MQNQNKIEKLRIQLKPVMPELYKPNKLEHQRHLVIFKVQLHIEFENKIFVNTDFLGYAFKTMSEVKVKLRFIFSSDHAYSFLNINDNTCRFQTSVVRGCLKFHLGRELTRNVFIQIDLCKVKIQNCIRSGK
jgi:hypothetical protein